MRIRDDIDAELRLLVAARGAIREQDVIRRAARSTS
jgi:hypothetical protein